jgi:CRP/FNR family cyclic AMP-dependent transcriptional regulator
LLLANFGKEGSPQPINPNVSQETLAEMIGTTRSRVIYPPKVAIRNGN